jgi:hypothetical protein
MRGEEHLEVLIPPDRAGNFVYDKGKTLQSPEVIASNLDGVSQGHQWVCVMSVEHTVIASRRGPQIGDAMPELVCTTTSIAPSNRFRGSMSGLKNSRIRVKAFLRLRLSARTCKHWSTVAGALNASCCAGERALA